jgi:hypothetical protein
MVGGNNGQDGFSSVPFARQKIVVQPPTIFCRILHVLPSSTAPACCWAVTVADRQGGATMTVDIDAKELQTYERFQAALLRETGSPFRYLPVEPQIAPRKDPPAPVSDVAAATRKNPPKIRLCVHHTPEAMLRRLCQLLHLLLPAEHCRLYIPYQLDGDDRPLLAGAGRTGSQGGVGCGCRVGRREYPSAT